MMSLDMTLDEVIKDVDLLVRVVEFKKKFYPRGWANYDLAKRGTLRLVPDEYRIKELEKDYISMQDMLFGDKPTFKEIIKAIKDLEMRINS